MDAFMYRDSDRASGFYRCSIIKARVSIVV